jgi:hypothetical protein
MEPFAGVQIYWGRPMPVYRVIDQDEFNELLPRLAHLPDNTKLEVTGLTIAAATMGELRKRMAQSLPFPFLMQVPRKPYPDAPVRIAPTD